MPAAMDLSTPKGSSELALERRALLIQMGGYTCNGREILYTEKGRSHLERVTMRKRLAFAAENGVRRFSSSSGEVFEPIAACAGLPCR